MAASGWGSQATGGHGRVSLWVSRVGGTDNRLTSPGVEVGGAFFASPWVMACEVLLRELP